MIKETQEAQEAEVESTIVKLHIMNAECQNKRPTTIWEEALPSEESSPRLSEFESDGELPSKGRLTMEGSELTHIGKVCCKVNS